jgi:hypothetical protein
MSRSDTGYTRSEESYLNHVPCRLRFGQPVFPANRYILTAAGR